MVEVPFVERRTGAIRVSASDTALSLLGVAAAAASFVGARAVRLPVASDYGLVVELPAFFWVGLFTLNILLGIALWRRRQPLTALLLLLLVGVVYGTPALLDGNPRLEVAWRHLGVSDVILKTGHVDPLVDAYFNWPGFFAGLAGFLDISGAAGTAVALVAPVANGLMWSVAVAAVVRALSPNVWQMWLAVWLFTLTNWIEQDYLSPQALAFFFYLVAVALVVRYLDARPSCTLREARAGAGSLAALRVWWRSRAPGHTDRRHRVAAVLLVILLGATTITAHQLTPFMLVAAVTGLAVIGRLWTPGLALVLTLLLMLWLVTFASAYLAGHPVLFQEGLGEAASATVAERTGGSPGHMAVVQVRTGITVVVLELAVLGIYRLRRARLLDARPLLLLVLPFAMLPFQSYGGEMILRVTLFALPFATYFATVGILGPSADHQGRRGTATAARPRLSLPRRRQLQLLATVSLSLLLSVGVMVGRYGNMAFDTFTDAEVRGVQRLYDLAPPGAVLVSAAKSTPWKYRSYTSFRYTSLTDVCETPIRVRSCFQAAYALIKSSKDGTFFLFTRAERQALKVQGDATSRDVRRLQQAMSVHGAELVYRNPDVRIFEFPPAKGAGR